MLKKLSQMTSKDKKFIIIRNLISRKSSLARKRTGEMMKLITF